jgi:16S rRNA (guanine966-N2)-methyltransferase
VRVIAGAAKGRRLTVPSGDGTRPTADRVKEALFSSLQAMLPGARVLDLYAGAGGLGLEALSRGASSVTFVESDRRALAALEANVATVGLPGAKVVGLDVRRALAGGGLVGPYDLVLLDPPYRLDADEVDEVLSLLVDRLASPARVSLERASRDRAPIWPAGLLGGEPRRYGDTTLHRADTGA